MGQEAQVGNSKSLYPKENDLSRETLKVADRSVGRRGKKENRDYRKEGSMVIAQNLLKREGLGSRFP